MFNIITFTTLFTVSIFEIYKYVIQKSYYYINFFKKNETTYDIFVFQLIAAWSFFTIQLNVIGGVMKLFLFILVAYAFFSYFFNRFCYYNNTFFVVLFIVYIYSLKNLTIVSILSVAELLSIAMFFILFFNNTKLNINNQTGAIFFVVTNIMVFLFGAMSIILLLHAYGTLDLWTLRELTNFSINRNVYLVFMVYVLFKFGQGPIVFFKFKFYRGISIFNISVYVFLYVILIWPILTVSMQMMTISSNIYIMSFITLVIIWFAVYSVFLYNSFVDFLVFSTWVFSLYTLMYALNIR